MWHGVRRCQILSLCQAKKEKKNILINSRYFVFHALFTGFHKSICQECIKSKQSSNCISDNLQWKTTWKWFESAISDDISSYPSCCHVRIGCKIWNFSVEVEEMNSNRSAEQSWGERVENTTRQRSNDFLSKITRTCW